jgi:FHS family L-fucose permease-like MFS transporter
MWLLFGIVTCCFAAWGVAADLTTPMVAGFKRIFEMSTFQASLVQLAYFGAYFLLAIPAALINKRFGYKAGLLTGLLLAAAGAIAFYPASKIMTYEAFLAALFAIAAGCSILETSANPYVLSLGPEETATRLLAATLILPKLDEPVNMANLTPAQEHTIRAGQLGAVMGPYLGLGFVLIAIALVFAFQKAPEIVEEYPSGDLEGKSPLKILFSNKHYVYGVIAQFFNVAAQVCTWTYIIQYSQQALHGSLQLGGFLLQVSLIVFLISRFIMTWVIGRVRATAALAVLGTLAVLLSIFAMFSPNMAGVVALVAVSFCLSLMFPTIYGVALEGLGPATKFGAAGLVMAIVGGAIGPVIQGRLLDATSPAISFVVPAVCFAVVTSFAFFDLTAKRHVGERDLKTESNTGERA